MTCGSAGPAHWPAIDDHKPQAAGLRQRRLTASCTPSRGPPPPRLRRGATTLRPHVGPEIRAGCSVRRMARFGSGAGIGPPTARQRWPWLGSSGGISPRTESRSGQQRLRGGRLRHALGLVATERREPRALQRSNDGRWARGRSSTSRSRTSLWSQHTETVRGTDVGGWTMEPRGGIGARPFTDTGRAMRGWLLGRLALLPSLLLVVSAVVFPLGELVPGDVVEFMTVELAMSPLLEMQRSVHGCGSDDATLSASTGWQNTPSAGPRSAFGGLCAPGRAARSARQAAWRMDAALLDLRA